MLDFLLRRVLLFKYLYLEYEWLKNNRPDEDTDYSSILTTAWYALNEEDHRFCNARGILIDNHEDGKFIWTQGNGFQYKMLDVILENKPELIHNLK